LSTQPKILVVIPARGGSKQLPRKNILEIAGKPLIGFTIELALELKSLFHKIIVSTDDLEIAEVSRNFGAEVPFLRTKELSLDTTPMVPVLKDAVEFIEAQDSIIIDWILLLQPTDPLREIKDIKAALRLAQKNECDSVISVERVYSHHPALMKKIVNNKIEPFLINEIEGTTRQNYDPPAYMRNGSIYLTKRKTLMDNESIRGEVSIPLIMKEGSRISIDSYNDFKLAELLIKEKGLSSDDK
jgi:CMP-N,N'-diacetyllegionaminic acid synthase